MVITKYLFGQFIQIDENLKIKRLNREILPQKPLIFEHIMFYVCMNIHLINRLLSYKKKKTGIPKSSIHNALEVLSKGMMDEVA